MSEKQQAHLAAVTIQHWWASAGAERLRRLGEGAAAAVVQAAWRGRAARAVVAVKRAEREEERRVIEVSVDNRPSCSAPRPQTVDQL